MTMSVDPQLRSWLSQVTPLVQAIPPASDRSKSTVANVSAGLRLAGRAVSTFCTDLLSGKGGLAPSGITAPSANATPLPAPPEMPVRTAASRLRALSYGATVHSFECGHTLLR